MCFNKTLFTKIVVDQTWPKLWSLLTQALGDEDLFRCGHEVFLILMPLL